MKLSIVIPVFNEQDTIESVLQRVASVSLPCGKEIIVVDDGSSDTTKSKIKNQKAKGKENISMIEHEKNMGKGAAIRSGIKKATGDYILIQDADLEYNPEEIPKLLRPILKPTTHNAQRTTHLAVYGSRFMNGRPPMPLLYYLGNAFLTTITNLLYHTRLTDMETGYKLLPAAFAKTISWKSTGFDIEPEITAQLVHAGIRIIEVPIQYHGRTHLAGKKLTIKDAVGAITTLIRQKFSVR